ncbi:unnamed protein product [Phytophthora fragariaefolia]|uniref:Unnamed protein product n=1 Tax=Phytophthora fragariaefolia TaxID=1490495 RepID=A0A9W6XNK2_9STRA|nr:unnamed protein product [Phytophthora fragariaefolia]
MMGDRGATGCSRDAAVAAAPRAAGGRSSTSGTTTSTSSTVSWPPLQVGVVDTGAEYWGTAAAAAAVAGGITKWKSEKREVETGEPQKVVAGAAYKAKPNEALAMSWEDVLAKIGSDTQIVDARGAARFYAKEPVRCHVHAGSRE